MSMPVALLNKPLTNRETCNIIPASLFTHPNYSSNRSNPTKVHDTHSMPCMNHTAAGQFPSIGVIHNYIINVAQGYTWRRYRTSTDLVVCLAFPCWQPCFQAHGFRPRIANKHIFASWLSHDKSTPHMKSANEAYWGRCCCITCLQLCWIIQDQLPYTPWVHPFYITAYPW